MNNKKIYDKITEFTFKKTYKIGIKHAKENQKYIKKTIKDLKKEISFKENSLIISAGPSLHRKKSLKILKKIGFDGYIICVDGSLGHCLRNGIIPDFVVTVDPDENRIVRWFGDHNIEYKLDDDYFRRQDLDPEFNEDEIKKNNELIKLVNTYGKDIKAIISTSSPINVSQRCIEAGMRLYWWNPIYDDYDKRESITKELFKMNKVPCMVTGGNVGSSAWIFAVSILNCKRTILIGMDFSYPPNTNVYNTQYYEFLKRLFPYNPEKGLMKIHNPYLKETWVTDPAYFWYNEGFKKMVKYYNGEIINATEGGILFGEGIKFRKFKDILMELKKI